MPSARPTNLRLLAGVPVGKLNNDEPQPDTTIPQCPSKDTLVKEIWDYTVEQLRVMELATMSDRDMLLAYCQAVAAHRRAGDQLEADGTFIKLLGTSQPHPALKVQKEMASLIKTLGNEFGLSPSARSRIHVSAQQPKKTTGRDSARLLSG